MSGIKSDRPRHDITGQRFGQLVAKLPDNYIKVYEAHGIDRFDSSIGYVLSNCVACCTDCNRMKMDMPADHFLDCISRISSHHNLQSE